MNLLILYKMSVNILSIKEALSLLPERKNLFFVPKDSVKYIRFVNGFDSFIPIKMHKNYDKEENRFETLICYDNCPYCPNGMSKPEFFLPIYECDENGSIYEQKEKLWQLPYGDLYHQINNAAGKPIKDNINKFAIRVERVGSKYKFDFKYIFPDYENLEITRINNNDDWVSFLINIYGDDYLRESIKNKNRLAQVVDEHISSPPLHNSTPKPTKSDPLLSKKYK